MLVPKFSSCSGCPSGKDCDAYGHGNYDRECPNGLTDIIGFGFMVNLLDAFLRVYPDVTFPRLDKGQEADTGHIFVDMLKDARGWIIDNPKGRGIKP